jgi:hypothetical protein
MNLQGLCVRVELFCLGFIYETFLLRSLQHGPPVTVEGGGLLPADVAQSNCSQVLWLTQTPEVQSSTQDPVFLAELHGDT